MSDIDDPPIRTISLVGNGPVARDAALRVDDSDLVVRINRAQLCGKAGTRTDAWAIIGHADFGRIVARGRPASRHALRGVKTFWLTVDPALQAGLPGHRDFERRVRRGRPALFLGDRPRIGVRETITAFGGGPDPVPSTGAFTLHYILDRYPDAVVRLFGFTHEGWNGHPWTAESAWMNALEERGRVIRTPFTGDGVRPDFFDVLTGQFMRGAHHARSLSRSARSALGLRDPI